MKLILPLALFVFAGCVHTAQHFAAPDSAPIRAAAGKLTAAVTASRAAVKDSSVAVAKAAASHDAETKRLEALEPKVGDLLRVAPLELRPAVEQIQGEVSALREEQAQTSLALTDAEGSQSIALGKLDEADKARIEVEKLSPSYLAQVDKLAAKLNSDEAAWAKDSKSLAWYRLHWFIGIIVMVGGILLCALWALVKFTARGAAMAAGIAAKF